MADGFTLPRQYREATTPPLFAAARRINTGLLQGIACLPASGYVVAAAHAIACAGNTAHRTYLNVLSGRTGLSAQTLGSTTQALVDGGWLRRHGRHHALGPRWLRTCRERHQWAGAGRINALWLAACASHPDRLALARTGLAVACVIGGTTADVAAATNTHPRAARAQVRRMVDLGWLTRTNTALAYGPHWPTLPTH